MPGSKKKSKVRSAKAQGKKKGVKKSDNRVNQRIPVQLLVDYQCDGNFLFDFCRDLGTGGVFIETKKPLSSGSQVDLTFTLPDSKETVEAKGKVIWAQSFIPGKDLTPGMGVQFESFDSKQREMLDKFLIRYKEKSGNSQKTAS